MAWFNITARAGTAVISIHDEIGAGGLSASDFNKQLRGLGRVGAISLHVNSPGGQVSDGFAIYNMLRQHPAQVTATVDGIAASIASYIIMAADQVIMPANALLMLHDPSGMVRGGKEAMETGAAALDRMRESMISGYAAKSGLPRERIASMMRVETWLSAAEALSAGFADEVTDPIRVAAHFDLSGFQHPPSAIEALSASYWARQRPPAAQKPAPAGLVPESALPDLVRTELPTPEEAYAVWNRDR